MATDIKVTPDERKFLRVLADNRTVPVEMPHKVLLSLAEKKLIGFGITPFGEFIISQLQKPADPA